jgi:signal transduction histidine kinase/CheY-like chemotaxis protein
MTTVDVLGPDRWQVRVGNVTLAWDLTSGCVTFEGLPVAMMWQDSTLKGLLSGAQAMVGTERFALALQNYGRKSIDEDWSVIAEAGSFEAGFEQIAHLAAVGGWGRWTLTALDRAAQRCVFRAHNSWESNCQRALNADWGSSLLAGKFAGYASRLFGVNCWAEQSRSVARGDAYDEFVVAPSLRSVELELERLLEHGAGTQADMAVALERLRNEIRVREAVESELRGMRDELEFRITERTSALEQALAELRASEARFRNVVETSPMGVHLYRLGSDDSLVFEGANAAADVILGVPNHGFVGQRLEDAFPTLQETEIPARYREVCRTGLPYLQESALLPGANPRWFALHAFCTGHQSMAVFFRETTEQVRAHAESEALRESLNRARRMEGLGLLAGGVAHDLNNILIGLTSYPELLLAELEPESPHRPTIQAILDSGLRAAAVVEDLLTVARGVAVARVALDLRDVVEDCLASPEFERVKREAPGVSYDVRLPDAPAVVIGSFVHLRKALMNLVLNAFEAVATEGTVEIAVFERLLAVSPPGWPDVRPGAFLMLSVRDSGGGIAQADLPRIFEPFYSTKVRGRSGTGLGLSIVWSVVREHDGFVDVATERGTTVFELGFPELKDGLVELGNVQAEPPRGHGECVLVVDDEPLQRDAAARMLARLGYVAQVVASGEVAVEVVRRGGVSVVLLDMVMPGGWGGRDTFLRLHECHHTLPVIPMSGHAEDDDVRAIQQCGGRPLLRKPFLLHPLAAALAAALGRTSDGPGDRSALTVDTE